MGRVRHGSRMRLWVTKHDGSRMAGMGHGSRIEAVHVFDGSQMRRKAGLRHRGSCRCMMIGMLPATFGLSLVRLRLGGLQVKEVKTWGPPGSIRVGPGQPPPGCIQVQVDGTPSQRQPDAPGRQTPRLSADTWGVIGCCCRATFAKLGRHGSVCKVCTVVVTWWSHGGHMVVTWWSRHPRPRVDSGNATTTA